MQLTPQRKEHLDALAMTLLVVCCAVFRPLHGTLQAKILLCCQLNDATDSTLEVGV